jgi:hypothetical protein
MMKSPQFGAVMLEFVLVFPILLALIFIAIWYSYVMNAKSSFVYATKAAARGALTRGDPYRVMGELALTGTSWHDWYNSANGNLDLFCNIPGEDCTDGTNSGPRWTKPLWDPDLASGAGAFCGVAESTLLARMPASYHYALLYTYRAIHQGVGNTAKFPCDPTPSTVAANGCVRCYIHIPTGSNYDCNSTFFPIQNIKMTCDFRPDNLLMSPIIALLGTFTNNPQLGVISSTVTAISG